VNGGAAAPARPDTVNQVELMTEQVVPAYEAQLMRKLTRKVVPFLCLCFMAAFLDRVNVGFAKEAMSKELGMSPVVYSLGASILTRIRVKPVGAASSRPTEARVASAQT
jgi:hypothetical protein